MGFHYTPSLPKKFYTFGTWVCITKSIRRPSQAGRLFLETRDGEGRGVLQLPIPEFPLRHPQNSINTKFTHIHFIYLQTLFLHTLFL